MPRNLLFIALPARFTWTLSIRLISQKQKTQGPWAAVGCKLKIEKIKTKCLKLKRMCVEESCFFNGDDISLQDVQPGQDCDLGDLRVEKN